MRQRSRCDSRAVATSMTPETHAQLASFIWSICNLLRGPYKRNEYRKVILPLTVLRRFDCLLAPTKAQVLAEHAKIKSKPDTVVRSLLEKVTGYPFYNLSKLDFPKLLDAPNDLAPNINAYINGFSPNVRAIMERFAFDQQIARMAEKNLLYEVIKKFAAVDLSPSRVDNTQMGYVFEELIRIGAEQANEEAGEHFTPREVIKLQFFETTSLSARMSSAWSATSRFSFRFSSSRLLSRCASGTPIPPLVTQPHSRIWLCAVCHMTCATSLICMCS
jgi:type I restriction-modification system DNA methylase subunit